MDKVKVKYVGDDEVYNGFDGDQPVSFTQGEEGEVSEAKAKQLAEDRPYDFEIGGKSAAKRPNRNEPKPAPADTPDAVTLETLIKDARPKLNELAAKHGITTAEQMPDKRTVATAILAAIEDAQAQ